MFYAVKLNKLRKFPNIIGIYLFSKDKIRLFDLIY